MSYRTTEAAVKKIVEVDASIDLDPFLEIANSLVTELLGSSSLGDTRLEQIERWLSAHFYRVRDPLSQSESAGGVSASPLGQAGMQFNLTREGQQVLLLDTTGAFARLQLNASKGKPKVGMFWGGTSE